MDSIVKTCYELPTSKDTSVFGPKFWDAFHDLASKIPCEGCKEESESFVRFWHDLKNYDLGKPLYDANNFRLWLNKVSSVRKEREEKTNRILLIVTVIVVTATLIATLIKTR